MKLPRHSASWAALATLGCDPSSGDEALPKAFRTHMSVLNMFQLHIFRSHASDYVLFAGLVLIRAATWLVP